MNKWIFRGRCFLFSFGWRKACAATSEVRIVWLSITTTSRTTSVGQAVSLSYDYEVEDECGTVQTCNSTFDVDALVTPLTATCPAAEALPECSTEADIQNAYDAWILGFTNAGGCGVISEN